jgi:hypothetical protein
VAQRSLKHSTDCALVTGNNYVNLFGACCFHGETSCEARQVKTLRIKLAPGGKLVRMPVSTLTTIADVVMYIQDKEAQTDFKLLFNHVAWEDNTARVVDLVDDFAVNVEVMSRDGLKGGGKCPRLKLATTRAGL